MRTITADQITSLVARLWAEANFCLDDSCHSALRRALRQERTPLAKNVLRQILTNARIAKTKKIPLCQDTGRAFIFVERGEDVRVVGVPGRNPRQDSSRILEQAINKGIALATRQYFLRASTVVHPLNRKNTGDNTPAVIHQTVVPGRRIKLILLAKGGGAENASTLICLNPTAEEKDIIAAVLKVVKEKGPNACPPLIIGIGLGGSFDQAPFLAKRSLLRPVGRPSPDRPTARLEKKILTAVNKLGLGPAAEGGRTTALAVHIATAPVHLASLPLAINFDCHVHRLKRAVI